MKKGMFFVFLPGILIVIAVVFILVLFLVKILWAWTVPDLFPGAVEQGLIAESISWMTSLKVAIFVAVLAGFTRVHSHKHKE